MSETKKKSIKGIEWLKSLPVGTRILSPAWQQEVVVWKHGLFWTSSGVLKKWDELTANSLQLSRACPERCPTWSPKDNPPRPIDEK